MLLCLLTLDRARNNSFAETPSPCLSKLQRTRSCSINDRHPCTTSYTMRLLQLVTTALLPFTALAAKKSSDRFQTNHAKQISNSGPVKLDDKAYNDLTKTPRDYSVAVLLTALEARFGCKLCNEFQPEWELLGKQWTKGDKKGEGRLIFATLDFGDGKSTFQSVRCAMDAMRAIPCLTC